MRELAQLKLIDGHEIVCEVVEWPDEKGEQFIIRNAMSIVVMETPDGDNAYVFRPFIHFLEDEKDFALLNSNHVMSMNRPKTYLSEQYDMSVQAMLESNRERLAEYEEAKQEGLRKFEEGMSKFLEGMSEEEDDGKPKSNVVDFPPKDTVH